MRVGDRIPPDAEVERLELKDGEIVVVTLAEHPPDGYMEALQDLASHFPKGTVTLILGNGATIASAKVHELEDAIAEALGERGPTLMDVAKFLEDNAVGLGNPDAALEYSRRLANLAGYRDVQDAPAPPE